MSSARFIAFAKLPPAKLEALLADREALTDVLRLSRGMTYKNAVAGLPFGGGKSVILARDGVPKTGELLGAHMIGAEVTEMIQGFTVGKTLETTEAELMHSVFPHPTLSESIGMAAEVFEGVCTDLPPMKKK